MAAAQAAGLEEFIASLPERYDTIVGERGANVSGGQRQRLAIARALLRRPDILIFDEATSHLDTATERAIQESMKTALAGRTVLLVAHRLSTVKDADLICVMLQGRIIEQGTHAELMALGGRYAGLWRAQTDTAAAGGSSAGQESRILALYMEGHSEPQIAERLGLAERRVRRLMERMQALVRHRGFSGLFRSLAGRTSSEPQRERVPLAEMSIYDLQLSN
jgi:ABC-type multidrug transport system ATPase subunit